jgi:hypothetical protein
MTAARKYDALFRTPRAAPDVRPPRDAETIAFGWIVDDDHRVKPARSGCWAHSVGREAPKVGAIRMCSTRKRALMILRNVMEDAFAERLAEVDAEIRRETRSPTKTAAATQTEHAALTERAALTETLVATMRICDGATLAAIGARLGVSTSRAGQIFNKWNRRQRHADAAAPLMREYLRSIARTL